MGLTGSGWWVPRHRLPVWYCSGVWPLTGVAGGYSPRNAAWPSCFDPAVHRVSLRLIILEIVDAGGVGRYLGRCSYGRPDLPGKPTINLFAEIAAAEEGFPAWSQNRPFMGHLFNLFLSRLSNPGQIRRMVYGWLLLSFSLCRHPWEFIGRTDRSVGQEGWFTKNRGRRLGAQAGSYKKLSATLDRNPPIPDLKHAALGFQRPGAGGPGFNEEREVFPGLFADGMDFEFRNHTGLRSARTPTMPGPLWDSKTAIRAGPLGRVDRMLARHLVMDLPLVLLGK